MLSFCVLLTQRRCLNNKYCAAFFARYVYLAFVFCFMKVRTLLTFEVSVLNNSTSIALGNHLESLFDTFAMCCILWCIWRGCQQRAFSLIMFDIMYTTLSWLVVCRTTWCLMNIESIERHTPYPCFVCSTFLLTIHLWGVDTFWSFVLFHEAKDFIDTSALSTCVTYWWTFTNF